MKPAAPAAIRACEPPPDALAGVAERLRAERDGAIRGAHHHGVPIAAIARMMKMSVQRVDQIVAG